MCYLIMSLLQFFSEGKGPYILFITCQTDIKPRADFMNGLKPGFGLKFKTLVLNSVKNVLSHRA